MKGIHPFASCLTPSLFKKPSQATLLSNVRCVPAPAAALCLSFFFRPASPFSPHSSQHTETHKHRAYNHLLHIKP